MTFEERQQAFVERLRDKPARALEEGTIVVLPSATFPTVELRKITAIQHYEERLLCLTLLLRDPATRVVYITSEAVDPAVVDYYLGFLPDPASARERLTMVVVGDGRPDALTAKVVDHPEVVDRIRAAVAGDNAYLLPFNVTALERQVAEAVGVPLFGPHPDLVWLGSKSGSRAVAERAGVAIPAGANSLSSLADIDQAIAALRPAPVVVKLNHGFSGQGNAIVDSGAGEWHGVRDAPTTFCADDESWPSFEAKIEEAGATVEELLRMPDLTSPSAQIRIRPGGIVEPMSTHDQILGGPENHVYLGCRFPARPLYRVAVQEAAVRVAEVLAGDGVIGPFGIDFLVTPEPTVRLSEINLRMGGTTHPFWMTRLVTDGSYDASTGELRAGGRAKSYVASDNLKSEALIGRSPADVIADVERRGLAFDPTRGTGATLHLLGALPRYGKMGATCIADTAAEADDLYQELAAALGG